MTCEECQENLSAFLDNELADAASAGVQVHLSICGECAKLCEELALILDSCEVSERSNSELQNSNALWCRINNIIESEVERDTVNAAPVPPSRRFSLPQATAAALCIAVISSLLTIVGVRNYFEPSVRDAAVRPEAEQTVFEKALSSVGIIDSPEEKRMKRVREQQAAIDYWNRRVQSRRSQWDANMRDAFDRNLRELDQAVSEYSVILEKDPQDTLSGEMLDSALNEKMNLLRAFSDL